MIDAATDAPDAKRQPLNACRISGALAEGRTRRNVLPCSRRAPVSARALMPEPAKNPIQRAKAPNIERHVYPSSRKMGNFEVPPSTRQEKGGMIPRGTLIRASRFYG